ncbi:MAG: tRNA lysidine(34) synthetase TilS [Gammaproteobacteria bacterium]|nr:tRNA lysidine(34) synthetase TilS [Gammaproteobacteria bacterium]MYK48172.1 tRNA lysidine(34) synthetase TilS [Gammaproteobacteria bacterium]
MLGESTPRTPCSGSCATPSATTPSPWAMVPDDCVERALLQTRVLDAFLGGRGPAGCLWVAFSGGVDSTVLLHALRTVPGTVAIHINHGLDPSASDWVQHCATVAREFGVQFESRSIRVDSRGNREQAARAARYAVFGELLAADDLLALGHHADDQAETRVWQLLTGREPGGMPTERRLGAGWLVRPLMGVRREQVYDYARRHGLRWIEDPANSDLGLDRNAIRHGVLRRLEERHPGALMRLSAPRRAAVACLRPLPVGEASDRGTEAWLLAAGLPTPSRTIAEIRRQSLAAEDRNPRVLVAPGTWACRYGDAWHIVADPGESTPKPIAVVVGDDVEMPDGILHWQPAAPGLPVGRSLSIGRRRGGERIRPLGRDCTKAVKALFQEAHVPPWRRAEWPLLYDGEALVAVPGLALAAEAVVANGCEPLWSPRRTIRKPLNTLKTP